MEAKNLRYFHKINASIFLFLRCTNKQKPAVNCRLSKKLNEITVNQLPQHQGIFLYQVQTEHRVILRW